MSFEFKMKNISVERAVKKSKRSIGDNSNSKSMMTIATNLALEATSAATGGGANTTTSIIPSTQAGSTPPTATIFSTSTGKLHNLNITFATQIILAAGATPAPNFSEVSFEVPLGTFKNPDISKQSFSITFVEKLIAGANQNQSPPASHTLNTCLIQNIVNNTATNKSKVTFNIGNQLYTLNTLFTMTDFNIRIEGHYISQ